VTRSARRDPGNTGAMPRVRALAVTLLAALCVAGGAPSTAGAGDSVRDTYVRYALVRERLVSCSLDRTWQHLGAQARKRCARYRRLYVLWSAPGESYRYHVQCRTSTCPRAPEGEPDPRAPLPPDAQIFR
jgi:hypothetical protein